MNKPAFGFEGYNPKPTHNDLIESTKYSISKQKRKTIFDEYISNHAFVPAPNTTSPSTTFKDNKAPKYTFDKDARNMLADIL